MDRITWLPRQKIDDLLWNNTIANSLYPCIYATTQWLDHFSPDWTALIYRDYEIIMPVTAKKKLSIPYLAQPHFTQQLGLFSKNGITKQLLQAFVKRLQDKYAFAEICVNGFFEKFNNVVPRKNYILDLNNSHEKIAAAYSKSLRQHIQKAQQAPLGFSQTSDIGLAIKTFKKLHSEKLAIKNIDYARLQHVAEQFLQSGDCFVGEVRNTKQELLSIGLFFCSMQRIYKTITATSPHGRVARAHHFMVDEVIQLFATTGNILDFEGSAIPGVEMFNKSFGARLMPYYFLRWNHLKAPLKWVKK